MSAPRGGKRKKSLSKGQPLSYDPGHLDVLLERTKGGDRGAAAMLCDICAPMIRRRIRGRLGRGMRPLMDTQDILATVGRRLDECVIEHRIRAMSLQQFYAFLLGIADRALLEKARAVRHIRHSENRYAQALDRKGGAAPVVAQEEVARAMKTLESPLDRDLVMMQLAGKSHRAIGRLVGMSTEAVRQRWRTVRIKLAARLKGPSTRA